MDYKKKYEEALERAAQLNKERAIRHLKLSSDIDYIFPELKEGGDEIRKAILELVRQSSEILDKQNQNNMIAWLEKQGEETSWKPSKEEMDVLYGLAYITNQYDEHKEGVITRLYQDLKREFFNDSSYENMFPTNTSTEDDVRRRSTIQVLEYARSLDAYNQYGKADIDKNIAWLEKQSEDKKEINNFDVFPGLYKCVHRMFDGTPDGRLLFEVGNVYKCLSKHDRAEFEVSYGHSVYLEDPVVCKYFIPFESKGEQKPANSAKTCKSE